jgi:hypothetical protein
MTGGRSADCRSSPAQLPNTDLSASQPVIACCDADKSVLGRGAGLSGRTGACSRATKEANLRAASQSAIDAGRGSVKRLCAIEDRVLGVDVGGHHSGGCQRGTREDHAVAAVRGQTPAECSAFT